MKHLRRGTRPIFALAISAALGFGATQAIAAPGSAQSLACNKQYTVWCENGAASACANYCASLGFTGSRCDNDPYRPRSCCQCF